MDTIEIKKELERCVECGLCMEEGICPSYSLRKEDVYSPLGRLNALRQILDGERREDILKSLLTCNGCGRCTQVCPSEINIGELIVYGRNILYREGILPLDSQRRIIESIIKRGNAVLKEDEKRLTYRDSYREFFEEESDTLLFLGCISSFFQGDTVDATINTLRRLGIRFRILKDEGCCGIFLYDGGYFDKAEELFKKNRDRFYSLGIREIIVLCPSCYKCFSMYYPRLIGKFEIKITHFVEVVARNIEEKSILSSFSKEIMLHEPCKMTRFMNIIEEPRNLLRLLGIPFREFDQNRKMSLCCGAGGGVRAYDMGLALEIGDSVLKRAEDRDIVTMCPFCKMNFNSASKRYKRGIRAYHIAEVIWQT